MQFTGHKLDNPHLEGAILSQLWHESWFVCRVVYCCSIYDFVSDKLRFVYVFWCLLHLPADVCTILLSAVWVLSNLH